MLTGLSTISRELGRNRSGRRDRSDHLFANPYHSWKRGLNEHTNGLVRVPASQVRAVESLEGGHSSPIPEARARRARSRSTETSPKRP